MKLSWSTIPVHTTLRSVKIGKTRVRRWTRQHKSLAAPADVVSCHALCCAGGHLIAASQTDKQPCALTLTFWTFLSRSSCLPLYVKSVCVFTASAQWCDCGTHFLQPCLNCLPKTFLETLHVFIRVRRVAVAMHLSHSANHVTSTASRFWADPNGEQCRERCRGFISKEHRWYSTTGLNEPFG